MGETPGDDTDQPEHCGHSGRYWDRDSYEYREYTCGRPVWLHEGDEAGHCIWHADVPDKPRDELVAALDTEDRSVRLVLGPAFLSRAELSRTDLSGAELRSATLTGAKLYKTDLSRADLRPANLSGAHLFKTNLAEADLRSATLTGADLRSATLTGTDLRSATLTGADLEGADLSDADLTKATLVATDLEDATLRNTNLSRADLRYALLDHTHLLDTRLDGETTFSEDGELRNSYELLADWLAEGNSDHAARTNSRETGPIDYHETTRTLHAAETVPQERSRVTRWRRAIERWRTRPILDEGMPYVKQTHDRPEVDLLRRANRTYLNLQGVLRANGMGDEAHQYFLRRKHVARKLARAEGRHRDWLGLAAERWLLGHGEKPWHVIMLAAFVVLVSAAFYALVGVDPPGEPDAVVRLTPGLVVPSGEAVTAIAWSLLLSISTFFLAGGTSGVVLNDSTAGYVVTVLETVAGAALFAVFFYTLGRAVER